MELIKVMVVDDDLLAVQYIKELIDWECEGFKIVSTAFNGKQALKNFALTHPELVITDISMPLMNGIELVKEIKKSDSDVCTILLTAYEEFHYAREAIREGVTSYIIKDELTKELLLTVLKETKERLFKYRRISDMIFQKALTDLKTEGSAFVRQHYPDKNIADFFRGRFQVMFIQVTPVLTADQNNHLERRTAISAVQMLDQISGIELYDLQILQQGVLDERTAILFVRTGAKGESEAAMCMKSAAVMIRASLADRFAAKFSCFYESRRQRAEWLEQWMNNLWRMELYTVLYGPGGNWDIQLAEGNLQACNRITVVADEYVSDIAELAGILDSFMEKEPDEALVLLEHCLQNIFAAEKMNSLPQLVQKIWQVMGVYEKLTARKKPETVDFEYLKDVIHYLIDTGKETMTVLYQKRTGHMSPEVRRAVLWLQNHYYDRHLTIPRLAESVGMSSSRLSVKFKQETGKTINQYLTDLRIREAVRLLEGGQHKIYEIAEQVGYVNSQYLSKIFYKETGSYPSEYKRNCGDR